MKSWLLWLFASLGLGLALSLVLESMDLAAPFLSAPAWNAVVLLLGGTVERSVEGTPSARVPFAPLLLIAGLLLLSSWWGSAWLYRRRSKNVMSDAADDIASQLWSFWLLPGLWSVLWLTVTIAGWTSGLGFLARSVDLTFATSIGAIIGTLFAIAMRTPAEHDESTTASRSGWIIVCLAMLVYTVAFTALNWGLWFNLRLPHGDSSMYEEHLWNFLHGKGFRSYLDQGLFLGEHIQLVHLLLIPVYMLWPSHLCLELCGSAILASAAIPIYVIARRHSGSDRAATLLALVYLLYFPTHYLDIAVDLKTFRPNGLGIPLLLWTLNYLERRRWGLTTLFAVLTLSCQEDWAIPLGLVGFWLLVTSFFSKRETEHRQENMFAGGVLWVLSMAYLALVLKVAFPYFREGAEIHYVSYFQKFGATSSEVVWNILTKPRLLMDEVLAPSKLIYALQLLIPLAFLPVRAPGRALTALPLFVLLCLNELAQQPPSPVHHFHAPLIPLLFWAAAAGLKNRAIDTSPPLPGSESLWPSLAFGMALTSAVIFSMSPIGLKFWDPGRSMSWRNQYVEDDRAKAFAAVEKLVPANARVASTDFVHPRFTHCERSYDYSKYPRRVANYEDRVPEDTDYIVIDFQHPYSEVRSLKQIRELQREPDQWELLTDPKNKYFAVLKRRSTSQ